MNYLWFGDKEGQGEGDTCRHTHIPHLDPVHKYTERNHLSTVCIYTGAVGPVEMQGQARHREVCARAFYVVKSQLVHAPMQPLRVLLDISIDTGI